MKEQALRQVIREEIERVEMDAGEVRQEIERFLSSKGEERAGTYIYKGYRFSTDQMGDMAAFVSMEHAEVDPTVRGQEIGSATVEDGRVSFGSKMRPQASYEGPGKLIKQMIRRFG